MNKLQKGLWIIAGSAIAGLNFVVGAKWVKLVGDLLFGPEVTVSHVHLTNDALDKLGLQNKEVPDGTDSGEKDIS